MNPKEHVWDALGRRVAGRQPPPQTLQELERALLEEWDRIPQLVINSLIDSMPQRLVGKELPFLLATKKPKGHVNENTRTMNTKLPEFLVSHYRRVWPGVALVEHNASSVGPFWPFLVNPSFKRSNC
ncbi:transposable element Tcb2 transposase [Trichonephila clavipes]|nr:transposable element Tcb2 transposase [Trichonephila clavipes]